MGIAPGFGQDFPINKTLRKGKAREILDLGFWRGHYQVKRLFPGSWYSVGLVESW
jgi:hypothetical protein